MKKAFDTEKYLTFQLAAIKKRIKNDHSRVYIEFGGKLIQDRHSARVLPGYDEDIKLKILQEIQGKLDGEVILAVSAKDIDRGRIRGDFKIAYDLETIRTVTEFRKRGLKLRYVVITMVDSETGPSDRVIKLSDMLSNKKIQVYHFCRFDNYKSDNFDFEKIEGNPFVKIDKKLVAIVSPGGGSGKFGVCLSQLYHEMKNGLSPQYIKFETFPVKNLDLCHPLNLAYMAASADFYDQVMNDRRATGFTSYNRDLENYDLLNKLAKLFPKNGIYLAKISSATDMGINQLTKGIIDREIVCMEAAAEVARRLIRYKYEVLAHKEKKEVLDRVKDILRLLCETN